MQYVYNYLYIYKNQIVMRGFVKILLISLLVFSAVSIRQNQNVGHSSPDAANSEQGDIKQKESVQPNKGRTDLQKGEKLQLGPIAPIIFPLGTIVEEDTYSEQVPQQDYEPTLLGGWSELDTKQPKGVTVQIDSMIKQKFPKIKSKESLKLIKAEKQVVYGWNYHFVYEGLQKVQNDNGTIHTVSTTYQFYCYQDPDQSTAQALVQTYEEKQVTTDSAEQIVSQNLISISGEDLTADNLPKSQDWKQRQEELVQQLQQQNEFQDSIFRSILKWSLEDNDQDSVEKQVKQSN